jgi:hypothetical protein
LHVGAGTFQPVKTDNIKDHTMHSEYYEISQDSVDKPALACNVLFDKDHLSEMECVQTTDISL